MSAPTVGAKARKKRKKKHAKGGAAAPVQVAVQPARWRWLAYNGGAAAVGHCLVWGVTGEPMAGAELMGRMAVSVPQLGAAAATVGAAFGGWHAVKLVGLHKLPSVGLLARPAAAVGAAMWGQGTAPLIADAMAATYPWSTLLAPLLAAGPVAAACWWGLDRNAAAATGRLNIPPVRWLARVPLATVALSSLLYAPGALL